jgi:hypothetical protein
MSIWFSDIPDIPSAEIKKNSFFIYDEIWYW